MKVFQLKNTPAAKDYEGCGHAVLVVRDGLPQLLIYCPDPEVKFSSSVIKVPENDAEREQVMKTTQVYTGLVSCYEFTVDEKIFPPKEP